VSANSVGFSGENKKSTPKKLVTSLNCLRTDWGGGLVLKKIRLILGGDKIENGIFYIRPLVL